MTPLDPVLRRELTYWQRPDLLVAVSLIEWTLPLIVGWRLAGIWLEPQNE
jgi:hypothetical protein